MNSRSSAPSNHSILWLQVWGLAAVQGAIALTWVIYNLYLPQLLTDFGFAASLATGIVILENILGALMEPLMGNFSDQTQRWLGTRFPYIAIGTVLSSAFFILIPLLAILVDPSGVIQWLLPIVLVAWALAMTVFRSPAMSLLGRYAFGTKLPQAASILTLVGGVAGAMGPLANQFILDLGPVVTFGAGSITLLVAATALRYTRPDQSVQPDPASETPEETPSAGLSISIPHLALVFGTGVGIGLGFRLLMQTVPQIVAELPGVKGSLIQGVIFVALALTAIPAGTVATRLGNRLAMIIGLGAMAIFLGLITLTQNGIMIAVMAALIGGSFSMVSNGTIPFALSMVPPAKAGLGTGIFFSGGAVAASLFGSFFGSNPLSPSVGAAIGAGAFLVSGLCVAATTRLPAIDPVLSES